ncbi:MAG TPA: hypothetical protein PK156_35815 [Polyangium sp.]|nr:hypothetical protein [Polyangium sp.]
MSDMVFLGNTHPRARFLAPDVITSRATDSLQRVACLGLLQHLRQRRNGAFRPENAVCQGFGAFRRPTVCTKCSLAWDGLGALATDAEEML